MCTGVRAGLGSVRSVPFRPFHSVALRYVTLRYVPYCSIPLRSVMLRYAPFRYNPFRNVPFCQARGKAEPMTAAATLEVARLQVCIAHTYILILLYTYIHTCAVYERFLPQHAWLFSYLIGVGLAQPAYCGSQLAIVLWGKEPNRRIGSKIGIVRSRGRLRFLFRDFVGACLLM